MRAERGPWALLLPAAAVFMALFVLPLLLFFVISFWRIRLFALVPGFSVANYARTFHDYAGSIVFTFTIALAIAILTTVVAFGFAYVVRFRAGPFGPPLLFVALLTLFGGYLVKVYAW